MTRGPPRQMDGEAKRTDILEKWGRIIEWDDAEGLSRSNGDVHIWLVEKLFEFLKRRFRAGWYGQEFDKAELARCMACFFWTD